MTEAVNENIQSVARLSRDLANAAATLTDAEARFLVDAYYAMQKNRIRAGNQELALTKSGEPHAVLSWFKSQDAILEDQVKRALDKYSASRPLGEWARGIVGIGPVLAAGLLAHIDIGKCQTAGAIWRYAGLDPTSKWKAGEKRPWNASLKTLCWKIGESFVKVKGNENDVYGKLYEQRRKLEDEKNERGEFAAQAKAVLEARPNHKQKAVYVQGKLPDGHLHARVKRYAVKIFLAHFFETGYRMLHGKEPPMPYPIAHLGHVHRIEAPK